MDFEIMESYVKIWKSCFQITGLINKKYLGRFALALFVKSAAIWMLN